MQQPSTQQCRLKMKFNAPQQYASNLHQDLLAMSKPEYHGKDFF